MVSLKGAVLRAGVGLLALSQTGCLASYLVKSSYEHVKILNNRRPIAEALDDPNIDAEIKRKLTLAMQARKFAEAKLGLTPTDNYKSFVELGRPYVTYVLRAAPAYELKAHTWWYPIVGSMPYRGFFTKAEAQDEAKKFDPSQYDTFVRGVTAYSTLGWFDDPILSSMMRYKDHDLVNLIIHETVHATIFIDDHADFNESLATFLGNVGTEKYYKTLEGENSKTVDLIGRENHDDQVFSKFIGREISDLGTWYKSAKSNHSPSLKSQQLQLIKARFQSEIKPLLKSNKYEYFNKIELNNARLMSFKTYYRDLSDFHKLLTLADGNFSKLLQYCRQLESAKDPGKALKSLINDLKKNTAIKIDNGSNSDSQIEPNSRQTALALQQ